MLSKVIMKDKYSKENLETIVKGSNSIAGVCRGLGVSTRGGNFKTVKKYINLHKIDTSHFLTKEQHVKLMIQSNTTPTEDVFCVNSRVSQSSLRKAVVRGEVIPYRCNKCKNEGEWQGEELVLQLDHVNGVPNDNRIENLRFLCPNCHTQTKTWGIKNKGVYKGKTNKCECGKEITKGAKKCPSCCNSRINVKLRRADRPPFKQLLEEVTELGYSGTGRKYGVSDNAIRKWINSYEKYKE